MKKILLTGFVALSALATAQYSWIPQGTHLSTSFAVQTISIIDADNVWISVYDGSGAQTYPKVLAKTTNGGTTWTPQNVTGLTNQTGVMISDVAAIDAQTAFIVTAPTGTNPAGNGIYKTTNGGTSWTQQTAYSNASFANQIYFWNANEGFSAGDPVPVGGNFEIYRTVNGGTNWTPVTGPAAGDPDEYGYNADNKYVLGDHVWIGTSRGRLLHTANRGVTWDMISTPVQDYGGNIVAGSSGTFAWKDANNGICIAVDGGGTSVVMYYTDDAGGTWNPMDDLGLNGTWYWGDIAHVPGTNTYVTTGANPNGDDTWMGSAYSTDGGITWVSMGDEGQQRGTVSFLNNSTGWAGQFSDGPTGVTGILKFNGSFPLMAVKDVATKSNLQIYPNPTSDIVNISSNNEVKSITIYDMSGKMVKTYAGAKEINISSLAKGNYVLQAHYANGGVENTKLIKK
ncbi:MAG: T9SS type A sorting domain-containing protein [Flavobacteriaceae bacterium]|jgi:hypothetical protein|nr:T9SS type A sorting domain-containing protein [Flavobacteriaceae bacterium]